MSPTEPETANETANENESDTNTSPTLPSVVGGGGNQLLTELDRMLKENADYKSRNEALEEELRRLRTRTRARISITTQPQVEGGDSAEQPQEAEQSQEKTNTHSIAHFQHQIVALQGRNQAAELMLQRKKEENEKQLETIIQIKAENMILHEKQQQQQENGNAILQPLNDDTANNDVTKSSQENGAVEENTTITTAATVEELQDTIEHLQNRLMHQVEDKLILQTKVETLEHLLVEEKGALKSTIESMTAPPKRRSPAPAPQVVQPQQTARQADIIREALERKKSKNLRARIGTKVYNSGDQKIDVQAYQELYEEQEKQKRLDQRIRKRRPISETKSSASSSSSSLSGAPSVPIIQQTTTEPGSSSYSPSPKEDEAILLHKIGSQNLTTRLWDFDDWEVQSEKDKV